MSPNATSSAATRPAAILFGSISTLAETSQMQLEAFNRSFAEAELGWEWDEPSYREMLKRSGGRDRIAAYAAARGDTVDAAALHARKTEIFDRLMASERLKLRPGVAEVIAMAKADDIRLAFVTTTMPENVAAILDATDGIAREDFAYVGDRTMVETGKPDPECYIKALSALRVDAIECVAIEDTAVCFAAPRAAGIPTIAFPNLFSDDEGFDGAMRVTRTLDPAHFHTG